MADGKGAMLVKRRLSGKAERRESVPDTKQVKNLQRFHAPFTMTPQFRSLIRRRDVPS